MLDALDILTHASPLFYLTVVLMTALIALR